MRKMKALTVKMETVTLVKVGRIQHALCIKCMKLIVKYFFSRHFILAGGGSSSIWINIFFWKTHFSEGSSQNRVVLCSCKNSTINFIYRYFSICTSSLSSM